MKWLYTDSPLFFITATAFERRRMLAREELRQAFLSFSRGAAQRGAFVGRYVFMPDHLHLFAAFAPAGPSLSKWVQMLKIALAKTLRDAGLKGPFWQKGFFDHLLRSAESYQDKWEYVRQNPVRAGLVRSADEWPYQGEVFRLEL